MAVQYLLLSVSAALTSLAALAIVASMALRGWLDLKRSEFDRGAPLEHARSSAIDRIEMADLRERIRKLEAIAAGVDI